MLYVSFDRKLQSRLSGAARRLSLPVNEMRRKLLKSGLMMMLNDPRPIILCACAKPGSEIEMIRRLDNM